MPQSGLDADLEPLLEEAFSHVIQLLAVPSRNKFVTIGSAVLIRTRTDGFFAVTAGHVLDAAGGEPVMAVGRREKKLVRLRYSDALTTEPRMQCRRGDRVDLAVVPIDQRTADKLMALGPVFGSELMLSDEIDPRSGVCVHRLPVFAE